MSLRSSLFLRMSSSFVGLGVGSSLFPSCPLISVSDCVSSQFSNNFFLEPARVYFLSVLSGVAKTKSSSSLLNGLDTPVVQCSKGQNCFECS